MSAAACNKKGASCEAPMARQQPQPHPLLLPEQPQPLLPQQQKRIMMRMMIQRQLLHPLLQNMIISLSPRWKYIPSVPAMRGGGHFLMLYVSVAVLSFLLLVP